MKAPTDELSSDAITAGFRIFQRRRGHRYSLDDLATAWEAARGRPDACSYLDLGCGIGSVLLMVAWRLQQALVYGIEALGLSAELARRSIVANGIEGRATVIEGDLRELSGSWPETKCDLVTGTPPYLPVGTALASPDPQRAAARMELRGGVEDYLAAAAKVLRSDGLVVVCADGRRPERVIEGAERAGLRPLRRRDIMPRSDAQTPLLSVWSLTNSPDPTTELEHLTLLIRDQDGHQTKEARGLRAFFGLPL